MSVSNTLFSRFINQEQKKKPVEDFNGSPSIYIKQHPKRVISLRILLR